MAKEVPTCARCERPIDDDAELVITARGPMHEWPCAEYSDLFKYDPGDSVWPR